LGEDHVDDDPAKIICIWQAVKVIVCSQNKDILNRISITCKFQPRVTDVIVTLRLFELRRLRDQEPEKPNIN
jgi:hypothetical protein